jgi:hypothetical protein
MSDRESAAMHRLVAADFQDMAKNTAIFVTAHEGDFLYAEYLAAFPEGTNPIFRKKTEHDCSNCRHFIRRIGNVVTIKENGRLRTVWDKAAESAPEPYRTVAAHLRDTVMDSNIVDLFRVGSNETAFGAAQTRAMDLATGKVVTWGHLHTGEIPRSLRVASPDQVRGEYRTTAQVFERGLVELSAGRDGDGDLG